MLGFYGIQLEDLDTGALCRAQNFQPGFYNLNSHRHNNLRITRIVKSLGELGLEHYQAPPVCFFLEETLVQHQLPSVCQSFLDYFMFAVHCRHQRRELFYFAWEHFRPRCQFVWWPHEKLQRFRPQGKARPLMVLVQADKDEGSRKPIKKAGTQGRTYGSRRDLSGDSGTAEDPSLLSTNPRIPEHWMRTRGKRLSHRAPNRARRGSRGEQTPGG